uniref:Fatty acyl-CoA reductase n=1 Tax=Timema shepardi TaxID=629360 RepID=A0A7R9G3L1_TIMSH|nr:unnamed protein product [Timema shepardi]
MHSWRNSGPVLGRGVLAQFGSELRELAQFGQAPSIAVIGPWPNTYTFTKAIAENIIKKTASDLPIAIVRPSQVSGTLKEPVCGWIDNVYGPNGVAAGFLAGLIRTGVSHEETKLNMVPVDMVANCIIASAFGAITR